ncbi:flagellar biosynthesis protein FlhB [Pseudomonas aeruginosa]
MAENSSPDDKTEAATPRRLEKAREEGQIARSRELTTFVMLLVGVSTVWITGTFMAQELMKVMQTAMGFSQAMARDPQAVIEQLKLLAYHGLMALIPLLVAILVASLVAPALLGGWLFSTKSLKFNFGKMNPLAGIKRMFSMHSLTELIKSLAKAALVGIVAVVFIKSSVRELSSLSQLPLNEAILLALTLVKKGCMFIVAALIIVVLIDVPYQLISFANKMKMTRQEIKDEHKENEGDPHVKGRIRAQQQAMARSRMMSKVPKASVVVTNPTHFAVALEYDENGLSAPKVVAKGLDAVALRIREVATEHKVPILEAPELARALYYNVDLDREIPADLYTAVAEVLAWVYKLRKAMIGEEMFPPLPRNLPVPVGMDQKPKRKGLLRRR